MINDSKIVCSDESRKKEQLCPLVTRFYYLVYMFYSRWDIYIIAARIAWDRDTYTCHGNVQVGDTLPLRHVKLARNFRDTAPRNGIFAFSAFEVACSFGSMEAMEELLLRETEISNGLHFAMVFRGGTAKLVNRLIQLRADVNHQWREPFWTFHGIYNHIQALQYRMGKRTTSTMIAYHIYGSTPLMNAVLSGQYEGAATLIAAGARLDLCNDRRRSVADFAEELSVPEFLSQALQGNPKACHRIAELADDDVFEI